MKALLLVLGLALAMGQEFPESRRASSTAVLLASPGHFGGGRKPFQEQQLRKDFQGREFSDAGNRGFQRNYRGDDFQQTTVRSGLLTPNNQNRFQSFDDRFQSSSTFLNGDSGFNNQVQQETELQVKQDNRFQQNYQDNRSQQNNQNNLSQQQNQNRFGSFHKENQNRFGSFQQENQNRFGSFQQENQNRLGSFQQENQNRLGSPQQENQNNQFRSNSFGQNIRRDSFNQERSSNFQKNSIHQVEVSQDFYDGFTEPLNLSSGASQLMGQIDTSFQCADRPYGYYADQANACRVFHVCNPYRFDDGRVDTHQYSFMCGEDRVFDQKKLTCVEEYSALPCQEAANFYFRNEEFDRPEGKL